MRHSDETNEPSSFGLQSCSRVRMRDYSQNRDYECLVSENRG